MSGNSLMIYICNFHVLNNLLLIHICKLHWNRDTLDWLQLIMSFLLVIWLVYYLEGWKEQEAAIKLKWGTSGYEDVERNRPEFVGELLEDGTMMRSVFTRTHSDFNPEI